MHLSVQERILLESMFDIPESDIVGVRVDEEAVKTNKCPEYIRARPTPAAETSPTPAETKNSDEHESKISMPTG